MRGTNMADTNKIVEQLSGLTVLEIAGLVKELEEKWGDVDICGAGSPFNIDAKLNGAYIVMGLLYGDGDPMKTLEISTRCGQDSDCNPSNALAVLGVIKGFSGLPQNMQDGVEAMGDSIFIYTTYSFNSAVNSTNKYALELIAKDGGTVNEKKIMIKTQLPVAPALEVAFPNLVFDNKVRLVVKGEKRPESAGTRVYITSATIFKTAPKKNETYKYSFE